MPFLFFFISHHSYTKKKPCRILLCLTISLKKVCIKLMTHSSVLNLRTQSIIMHNTHNSDSEQQKDPMCTTMNDSCLRWLGGTQRWREQREHGGGEQGAPTDATGTVSGGRGGGWRALTNGQWQHTAGISDRPQMLPMVPAAGWQVTTAHRRHQQCQQRLSVAGALPYSGGACALPCTPYISPLCTTRNAHCVGTITEHSAKSKY